jgi:serine/threonine-protein kinase
MSQCLQCGHQDAAQFLFCPRCGTKAVEGGTVANPLLGRILNGKYRVESEIGQGAMGTVYLGEHIGLKKKIALKVLHSDLEVSDESLQRFQREGMAAGRFNHPHAIQIFDFDRSEPGASGSRVFYLAMEYVEGSNLSVFLRQRGKVASDVAVKLARQMLSCLAEAHRHGIVHRDLKPDNIMVSEASRGELRLKVLDFGLSKLVDRKLNSSLMTQPGRLLGTPLYMAPEQIAGLEADERSDVYAAGLILYEMLAGERPFQEKDAAALFLSRPTAEAPSLSAKHPELAISDALDELLLRAMQRDREQRFQTAEEMLNALDEVPLAQSAAANRSASPVRREAPRAPVPPAEPPAPAPLPSSEYVTRSRLRKLALVVLLASLLIKGGEKAYQHWWGTEAAPPARVRAVEAAKRNEQQQRYVGLLDEARLKLHGGDSQAALTAVNQASLLDCRDAEVFLVRAEIYRARGDLVSAMAELETAARAEPSAAEPHLGRGWIELERAQLDAAEASFARAGELAGETSAVLAARGAAAVARGAREAARPLLEQALAKDPACAEAHLFLGRLELEAGAPERAITQLAEAKSQSPFSIQPLVLLSRAYEAQGNLDLADAQLDEALRLEPASSELSARRGALLLERARFGEAQEFLIQATERLPQEGKLWVLRGIAAHEGGDAAAAIEALRRAFEVGARDPDARCLLGILYQEAGKLPEAIAQFEAVLRQEGEYPAANLNLGLVYFAQQKYHEARERFERVLAFDEENLQAQLYLGLLYKNVLGDDALALQHLERYQSLGGEDARLADWLDELR